MSDDTISQASPAHAEFTELVETISTAEQVDAPASEEAPAEHSGFQQIGDENGNIEGENYGARG